MKIRSIETRYNGYRFRSRTEARWAVFFDTLGIRYEYEKEGLSLPSGLYLPDFWLGDWRVWLEIKGAEPTEEEVQLCVELQEATGAAVLLATGAPGQEWFRLFAWDRTESSGGSGEYAAHIALRDGKSALFILDGDFHRDYFLDASMTRGTDSLGMLDFSGPVIRALNAARSARFEFGETPRI